MKKVFSIFLLFLTVFVMSGCSNADVSQNVSNIMYKEVKNEEDIIYNLNEAVNSVNGFSFTGVVTVKDKTYEINGEVIIKETIEKSTIHLNYKNNNLYLKNGKVYLSYYYNNTNVIIKDTLDNFLEEIINSLENKGIKCNEDKIYKIIKNKTIKDINYESLIKYLKAENAKYNFNYKSANVTLNDSFLPSSAKYENAHIKANIRFNYNNIAIKVPFGYNLLTIDIDEIKDLLKVEFISDLIK